MRNSVLWCWEQPIQVFIQGAMLTFHKKITDNSKTVEKIIALIKKIPKITQAELTNLTGLSRHGAEWNIRQLKQAGLLTRIGPDKGGNLKVIQTTRLASVSLVHISNNFGC